MQHLQKTGGGVPHFPTFLCSWRLPRPGRGVPNGGLRDVWTCGCDQGVARRGRRKRKKASGLESRQTWALKAAGPLGGLEALGGVGALGGSEVLGGVGVLGRPESGRVKPFSSTRMCMGWTGQRAGFT